MALQPDSDAVHKEANLWTVAQLAHGEGTLCRAFFANVGGAAAARTSSKGRWEWSAHETNGHTPQIEMKVEAQITEISCHKH
jgi:hypothetical protein